jgi:hypothetical protein
VTQKTYQLKLRISLLKNLNRLLLGAEVEVVVMLSKDQTIMLFLMAKIER